MNVVEMAISDATIAGLMDLVAQVRRGEVIGVTVVKTSASGAVDMVTLSVPLPTSDRLSA